MRAIKNHMLHKGKADFPMNPKMPRRTKKSQDITLEELLLSHKFRLTPRIGQLHSKDDSMKLNIEGRYVTPNSERNH